MGSTSSASFAHRFVDNRVDSICPRCFVTVATMETEVELEPFELEHNCDPLLLKRFTQILPLHSEKL